MQSQLNKALKLAKKTGDRLIVFESPESENAFVIMDLEQYEDLLDCACGEECECDCGHDHEGHEDFEPEIDGDFEDDDYAYKDDLSREASAKWDYASEVRSLTEEELLDKINRDIALWKESQKEVEGDEIEPLKSSENHGEDSETEIRNKSKWAIRNDVKENADEIIEEDRHYLEEVKY
jgi:hypothetical protein